MWCGPFMADYWINPNNCRVAAENARPAVEQNGLRALRPHRHADRSRHAPSRSTGCCRHRAGPAEEA